LRDQQEMHTQQLLDLHAQMDSLESRVSSVCPEILGRQHVDDASGDEPALSLQAKYEQLRDRQHSQAVALHNCQLRLSALESRLSSFEVDPPKRTSGVCMEMSRVQSASAMSTIPARISIDYTRKDSQMYDEHAVTYRLKRSIWDAAFLLTAHEMDMQTSVQIVTGWAVNMFLQGILLVVIWQDLLDSPLNDEVVKTMLEWRASHGHDSRSSNPISGKSFVQDICKMDRWSFEAETYKTLYEYLQQPMPGWLLSLVGIALWIFTMTVELRFVIDQMRLVLYLPTCSHADTRSFIKVDQHYELVSMGLRGKLVAMILCIPRLIAAVCLTVVGCQFVATTLALEDILLNSMALAFIIEIDELVASVFLPRYTQLLIDKIRPVASGTRSPSTARCADMSRCFLAILCTLAAGYYYLVPFVQEVGLASNALCGGYRNFSLHMHGDNEPWIPFMNNDEWFGSCSLEAQDSYEKNFGVRTVQVSERASGGRGENSYGSTVKKTALQFAFRSCGEAGRFKNSEGQCAGLQPGEPLVRFVPTVAEELPQWPNCLPHFQEWCTFPVGDAGPCWWPWAAGLCNFDNGVGFLRDIHCYNVTE